MELRSWIEDNRRTLLIVGWVFLLLGLGLLLVDLALVPRVERTQLKGPWTPELLDMRRQETLLATRDLFSSLICLFVGPLAALVGGISLSLTRGKEGFTLSGVSTIVFGVLLYYSSYTLGETPAFVPDARWLQRGSSFLLVVQLFSVVVTLLGLLLVCLGIGRSAGRDERGPSPPDAAQDQAPRSPVAITEPLPTEQRDQTDKSADSRGKLQVALAAFVVIFVIPLLTYLLTQNTEPVVKLPAGEPAGHQRAQLPPAQPLPNVSPRVMPEKHHALMKAIISGDVQLVRTLTEDRSIIHERGEYPWPPIVAAAFHSHREIVEILYGAGAEVNVQDRFGRTPLICAANNGDVQTVRELLLFGADPNLTDDDGLSALDYAKKMGFADVEALLSSKKDR